MAGFRKVFAFMPCLPMSDQFDAVLPGLRDPIGLCATCRHVRVVQSTRSTFYLCRLSEVDTRFAKYPRLPVVECAGYDLTANSEGDN
jgi:hypothetical protein